MTTLEMSTTGQTSVTNDMRCGVQLPITLHIFVLLGYQKFYFSDVERIRYFKAAPLSLPRKKKEKSMTLKS